MTGKPTGRDVWCCYDCLQWWPRSTPSLRRYGYGDSDVPCPGCGSTDMILLQRGEPRSVRPEPYSVAREP